MKEMIRNITFLFMAAICLCTMSCQKDDTLYYNNMTMGNIVDGRFISDQGNIFNIEKQAYDFRLDTMKRAIIICDVLNQVPGTENEYDIKLNQAAPVFTKDPVSLENATNPDILREDPIYIESYWYSGGYINMLLRFHLPKSSTKQHMINLVYSSSETGKYTFNLRHNAFGEDVTANDTDIIVAQSYVSFPISSVIKGDKASITLNWKWFKADGYIWVNEIKEYSAVYEWTRDSFEQTSTAQ